MNNKTLNNILVNKKLLETQGEIDNTIIISFQILAFETLRRQNLKT